MQYKSSPMFYTSSTPVPNFPYHHLLMPRLGKPATSTIKQKEEANSKLENAQQISINVSPSQWGLEIQKAATMIFTITTALFHLDFKTQILHH